MQLIDAWIERHPVLSKLGGAVVVMVGLYGGMWALATWEVKQAKPDTPTAHLYCAVIGQSADGSADQTTTRREFELSKELAFRQGGAEGVQKAKIKGEQIMAEYLVHMEKGDLADLRQHYEYKCQGY